MNWFFLLIIIAMGAAGYFEYQSLTGQVTVDQLQIDNLKTKGQQLTSNEQKASDHASQLGKSLSVAQAKAEDLQRQLQTTQTALATALRPPPTPPPAVSKSISPVTETAAVFTTKLGAINALDGKSYANCQLLKVNADSIVISNANEITQISLTDLPASTQKLFGLTNNQTVLNDDQVQSLERQRLAASAAGN